MHARQRGPTSMMPLISLALFLVTGAVGCSDDESPTEPDTFDASEYLLELPTWDSYCPPLADGEDVGDPIQEIDWDQRLICTRTECSLTATPDDIVTYNPGSEILYLGSLIQGDSYIGGVGSIAELPIRERAPLTITIDLHATDSSRTVADPTAATVGEAVHDLVAAAAAEGYQAGSSIYYNQTTSHSLEQSMLSLGMSARYMGAGVRASLAAEQTSEESSISAYFIQRMFTTSVVLPDRPGDFFSDEFTSPKLQEQIDRGRIGPDNLPVYVSNIVWGRMMVLTMTSSVESSRMKAALQASYAGIGGSVSAEHLEVLAQSTIKLVTVGGDAQSALDFLRSGNLGEFFREDAPLTTAVPLSYTLRNLADNSVAKVSETTSYELEECGNLEIAVYTNEAAWRNVVLTTGLTLHEWPTTRGNCGSATELPGPPANNTQSTSPWTWTTATTGFGFDFRLANTSYAGAGALVFNDQEMSCSDCIGIGDADDYENDDFEISVTGETVYALAVVIGDNNPNGEDMEVWAATVGGGQEFLQQLGGYDGFVGLISVVPLRRILYNEDSAGDDIYVRDLRFATVQ